jgi:hypothetical protein
MQPDCQEIVEVVRMIFLEILGFSLQEIMEFQQQERRAQRFQTRIIALLFRLFVVALNIDLEFHVQVRFI